MKLIGLPQGYLNRLVTHFDEGLVDLPTWFRQPWCMYASHGQFLSRQTCASSGLIVRLDCVRALYHDRFHELMSALKAEHECVGDVRGRGLFLGLEIIRDAESREPDHDLGSKISEEAFRRGLNMNIVKLPAMGAVFRIAPPLTISDAEIDQGLDIMASAIEAARA